MLSLANITGGGSRKYYESANGEYYNKESKVSEWQGNMAESLGLSEKEVNLDDFEKIANGFDLNKEKLVASAGNKNHRAGMDLTFAAPKSVSILSIQNVNLVEAHQDAVKNTLNFIEKNYIQTRKMENGKKIIQNTGQLIAAKFEHHLNRNQEPHLHTHNVIMNVTKDSDGKFKTIYNDKIYKDQNKLGQVYRSFLAKEIIERDYEIEITDRSKGFFELKGISREIIDDLSTRRQEVVETAKE